MDYRDRLFEAHEFSILALGAAVAAEEDAKQFRAVCRYLRGVI